MTWQDNAACRGMNTAIFYPSPDLTHAAQQVCAGCPVRTECAAAGRAEEHGVWAGELRDYRSPVPRPRQRKPRQRRCAVCGRVFEPTGNGVGTVRCSMECRAEWDRMRQRNARRQSQGRTERAEAG